MKILTNHEYDRLFSCVAVYPCNLQISNPGKTGAVDQLKASKQYNNLINFLADHGVSTYFLNINGGSSQVFARDIGFVIDDILFISNMTQPERSTEINALIDFTIKHNIKSHIMANRAEGGDILVDKGKIFVGVGNRTTEVAVEEIKQVLREAGKPYEFINIFFNASKIHLDCVFNILDQDTCIITPDVFNPQEISKHYSRKIEVPIEEQANLAANIVDLGNNKILCSSEAFCNILNEKGYNGIYIDFSEILKASGGLGCCLMPLLRE